MMDPASWLSVMTLVPLVAGLAVGLVAGHFASPAVGQAKRLRLELDRVLGEHEAYKASVSAHFRKTADLVGQMTQSYAAVYDHLAGGARRFCDETSAGTGVPFEPLPQVLAAPVIETAAEEAPRGAAPTDAAPAEAVRPGDEGSAAGAAIDPGSQTTTAAPAAGAE